MGPIAEHLVSIILPCHNAARFLSDGLDSALAQTYGELEVVAIDDGSKDGTLEILRETAARESRLRVLVNEEQRGIIQTLNRAVAEANGEYIARMDADDALAPDRIQRQLEILNARPEIGMVGTAALLSDQSGRVIGRLPVRCTHPLAAPFLALFATPLLHPTIMARSGVMRDFPYRDARECLHVEDYELFTRMLAGGVQLTNIDAPLYVKRSHPGGVSRRFEQIQIENFVEIANRQLQRTLGTRLGCGVYRVLLNRMDSTTTTGDLRQGLRLLGWLRDRFVNDLPHVEADARSEVSTIADQQRVDILGQAILKGPARRKLAGVALAARYASALGSEPMRRYLRNKVGRPRVPAGLTHQ